MRLKLQKLSNGLGFTVPSSAIEALGLIEGQAVELEIISDGFLLRKAAKYTLEELLAQCDLNEPKQ